MKGTRTNCRYNKDYLEYNKITPELTMCDYDESAERCTLACDPKYRPKERGESMTQEKYIVDYAIRMTDHLEELRMDNISKYDIVDAIADWLQGFLEEDGTIDSMKEGFCDNCEERKSGERMVNEGYL